MRSQLLLGVAALTACSNITENDVTLSNYGAVTITAKNAPAGRATATINAVFFQGVAATAPNSVVTRWETTKPCTTSTRHCAENIRPRRPRHRSRWSPRADSSMGEVSAVSPNEAVLQCGPD